MRQFVFYMRTMQISSDMQDSNQVTKDLCNQWDFTNHNLPLLFSCLFHLFLRLFFTCVATNRYCVVSHSVFSTIIHFSEKYRKKLEGEFNYYYMLLFFSLKNLNVIPLADVKKNDLIWIKINYIKYQENKWKTISCILKPVLNQANKHERIQTNIIASEKRY